MKTTHAQWKQVVCCLGIALCAALWGCGGTQAPGSQNAGITVSSTATVEVVPNKADISIGISTVADSAAKAQRDHARPVNAVVDALKEAGVKEEHIQTAYTDVSPMWDDEGTQTDSFEAHTVIDVDSLNVDEVADIMQACLDAGATEVNGPAYHTDDFDAQYDQALAQAIENSRVKAEAIAEASGVRLGGIIGVTEGYQDRLYATGEAGSASASSEDAMDIEPGQVSVEAQVSVTYAIG